MAIIIPTMIAGFIYLAQWPQGKKKAIQRECATAQVKLGFVL